MSCLSWPRVDQMRTKRSLKQPGIVGKALRGVNQSRVTTKTRVL